jgi:chromosome segregation and condensation protein ScpB
MTLDKVIEALLFSAQKPLSIREITTAIKSAEDPAAAGPNEFARVREAEVAAAIEQLKTDYVEQGRAFPLIEKTESWQPATDPKYAQTLRQPSKARSWVRLRWKHWRLLHIASPLRVPMWKRFAA